MLIKNSELNLLLYLVEFRAVRKTRAVDINLHVTKRILIPINILYHEYSTGGILRDLTDIWAKYSSWQNIPASKLFYWRNNLRFGWHLGEIFQLAEYSGLQTILPEIWMTFGRNILAGRIFCLTNYSAWRNTLRFGWHLGEIFQLAEYSGLQTILPEIWITFGRNILAGRIFCLANYSAWRNTLRFGWHLGTTFCWRKIPRL